MNRLTLCACTIIAACVAAGAGAATLDEQIANLQDAQNFEAVVKTGAPALDALKAALKGPRADLAAAALGKMKLPGGIPALLPLIEAKDGELRATVAMALGECAAGSAPAPEACAAIAKLCIDPYPAVRSAAVFALARLRATDSANAAVIEKAIEAAVADPDDETRLAAASAIRAGDRKDLWQVLAPRLDYRIEWVKPPESAKTPARSKDKSQNSTDSEKSVPPVLVEQVVWIEPSSRVRLGIVKTLAALRVPDSLPALITALERETSFNRKAIVQTIEAAGDPANPGHIPGLTGVCLGRVVPLPYDKQSFEKYMPILINNGTLAIIAGHLGDDRCVPYLLETLKLPRQTLGKDKDLTELFIQTVELLGKYKVERAARPLVTMLKETRIKQLSVALQTSIREIGHSASRPLASFAIGTNSSADDWQIAPMFFRMLREPSLRTRAVRDTILKFIEHESDELRFEATETLGLYLAEGLLDEYDVPMLDAMALDSNREVRASCAKWKAKLAEKGSQ